jgi:hypothetical protein
VAGRCTHRFRAVSACTSQRTRGVWPHVMLTRTNAARADQPCAGAPRAARRGVNSMGRSMAEGGDLCLRA